MQGEYMRIGNDGQFNPDPDVLHFATVLVHVPYKKRPRQDFQSDLESSSGRLEKAGKMDLGETQLMDARRLVRENNTMFLNG